MYVCGGGHGRVSPCSQHFKCLWGICILVLEQVIWHCFLVNKPCHLAEIRTMSWCAEMGEKQWCEKQLSASCYYCYLDAFYFFKSSKQKCFQTRDKGKRNRGYFHRNTDLLLLVDYTFLYLIILILVITNFIGVKI